MSKPKLLTLMVQMETTEHDPSKVVARVERELQLQFGHGVIVRRFEEVLMLAAGVEDPPDLG